MGAINLIFQSVGEIKAGLKPENFIVFDSSADYIADFIGVSENYLFSCDYANRFLYKYDLAGNLEQSVATGTSRGDRGFVDNKNQLIHMFSSGSAVLYVYDFDLNYVGTWSASNGIYNNMMGETEERIFFFATHTYYKPIIFDKDYNLLKGYSEFGTELNNMGQTVGTWLRSNYKKNEIVWIKSGNINQQVWFFDTDMNVHIISVPLQYFI